MKPEEQTIWEPIVAGNGSGLKVEELRGKEKKPQEEKEPKEQGCETLMHNF